MSLFQLGEFKLASGRKSSWKMDCDHLTPDDWKCLAHLARLILPPFGSVEGVPTGGWKFAEALQPYATAGPLLIADDVFTTGGSMNRFRNGREAIGIVAFARSTSVWKTDWVHPLFVANGLLRE